MSQDVEWHESLEVLVKKEAERSLALRWAHDESERWCASWNTKLMFPSIILATLTGAGSVGSAVLLPFDGAPALMGVCSLVVGMLQTIQNYFAFAKRSESHRIASLQYGKIHSHLELQLSLPRPERKIPSEIIDWLKVETERLSEIAPQIPLAIKKIFHEKFKDTPTAVPAILNGLEPVQITEITTPREKVKISLVPPPRVAV